MPGLEQLLKFTEPAAKAVLIENDIVYNKRFLLVISQLLPDYLQQVDGSI